MLTHLYAIWDEKAESMTSPAAFRTEAIAVRAAGLMATDKATTIGQHPEDHKLYYLGSFNDETGVITGLTTPKLVANLGALAELAKP